MRRPAFLTSVAESAAARAWAAAVLFVLLTACAATPVGSLGRTADPNAIIPGLLARPLRPPAMAPGGACPIAPPEVTPVSPLSGYLNADRILHLRYPRAADGLYESKVVWATDGVGYRGPVVVRVARLDAPGRGLVRLYYEDSASRGDAVIMSVEGLSRDWPSGTFVSDPGCYAYQLDGRGFTTHIVFRAIIDPLD